MKKEKFNLVDAIRNFFSITPYMPIMEWIERYINYSDDVSAERDTPDFSAFPYQIEPIKQWEDLNSRKQVTIVACEQMRKNKHVFAWSIMANGLRSMPKSSMLSQ